MDKKKLFPDITRSSKEKAKGLRKNNPLKPDDYIQQLYAVSKVKKKNGNKIRHIQRVLVFQPPLTNYQNYWKFAKKIQEFDK